ncbi:MAG TPA: hypothetical protein VMR06_07325 [Dokdonella sp.]|uniref:hypothetical protein n=1 Tax=Dokdonella sp. TaxID=2291710 RepID=UPI002BB7362B|nr:hypothetical protein [Dokdonella sp.]HUD41797.1 hypothetical protein [Dokdonella sp.]
MTTRKASIAAALVAALAAAGVSAARVDICYSEATAPNAAPPTSATVFVCPQAGSRSVAQLAAAGWRVIKMMPVTAGSGGFGVQQQLLIGDDTLFASGFDA